MQLYCVYYDVDKYKNTRYIPILTTGCQAHENSSTHGRGGESEQNTCFEEFCGWRRCCFENFILTK
jgi:hypothetical protein